MRITTYLLTIYSRFQAFLTELKKMGVIIDATEYLEGSRPDTFKKFELVREVYVKNKKHVLDANMVSKKYTI